MPDLPATARDEVERLAEEWNINVAIEQDETDEMVVLRVTSYTPQNSAYLFELDFPSDDDRTETEVRTEASKRFRALMETVLDHLTSDRRPEPGEWGRPTATE